MRSDANLSNLRFGGSPHPKHALSSSDLISEGCLLPEATTAAPLDPLHHGGSSGVLLECGPNGARNGAAEAAMHARHTSGGSALPQAGASTCDTALPLQHGHAADLYGLAAGVTAVGPSSAEVAHDALYPELPSPFSIGSGPEQDREGEAGLADACGQQTGVVGMPRGGTPICGGACLPCHYNAHDIQCLLASFLSGEHASRVTTMPTTSNAFLHPL